MRVKALIDTQAICIAANSGGPFSRKVRALFDDNDSDLFVSVASIVEIAIKVAIGKMELTSELLQAALRDLRLIVIPISERHALRLYSLPSHHRDPFDRIILATALEEDLPIVTGDRVFSRYKGVRTIW